MGIAFKRDAFESLLFAVALGVGLTPEFLPMISSVTLTQGALRMARDQVIVKHLPAIQDFGSIDILCSDKTVTTLVIVAIGTLLPVTPIAPLMGFTNPSGLSPARAWTLRATDTKVLWTFAGQGRILCKGICAKPGRLWD